MSFTTLMRFLYICLNFSMKQPFMMWLICSCSKKRFMQCLTYFLRLSEFLVCILQLKSQGSSMEGNFYLGHMQFLFPNFFFTLQAFFWKLQLVTMYNVTQSLRLTFSFSYATKYTFLYYWLYYILILYYFVFFIIWYTK